MFCLLTSYLEFRSETMALEVWNSGSQDFELSQESVDVCHKSLGAANRKSIS